MFQKLGRIKKLFYICSMEKQDKKIIIIGCGSEGKIVDVLFKLDKLKYDIETAGLDINATKLHIVEPDINLDDLKALVLEFQEKDFQCLIVKDGLTNLNLLPKENPFENELGGLPKLCENLIKDSMRKVESLRYVNYYMDEHSRDVNPHTRSNGGRKNNKKNYKR